MTRRRTWEAKDRAAKLADGECVDCRAPAAPNRRRCVAHLTAAKVREGLRAVGIKRGPSERKAGAS